MRISSADLRNLIYNDDIPIEDRLLVSPRPHEDEFTNQQPAVYECRLGKWFLNHVIYKTSHISPNQDSISRNQQRSREDRIFIDFNDVYILHAKQKCLATTLEWFVFPGNVAGKIDGKSSLARHLLSVHLAPNIHPGFMGCVTLEIINHGDIPIGLVPGMPIAQITFEKIASNHRSATRFGGKRYPIVSPIAPDDFMTKMIKF